MAIIQVNLTDTINSFRVKTNTLALQVGDTALLDTSGADSNTVSSINSLDSDMGRQADLHYNESSDGTFLTLVDAINRIVDSAGNLDSAVMSGITLDSDAVLNHMIADDQIDSSHILDSSITNAMIQIGAVDSDNFADSAMFARKFDAMTVLKIFASNGTELRKIYGPARFDKDSATTFRTNPWV
jgi:hypothetical protein|tara:strand:+ start:89 stop:643 length:555 start_codon:yes stop_codon:yes gene_type:complete